MCVQAISCAVNITWGKHMNLAETLVVLLHLVAFVLLIAVLGVATTTGLVTPSFTFTSETGWSPGFGVCLSTLYAVGVLSGFDCASHLGKRALYHALVPRFVNINHSRGYGECP